MTNKTEAPGATWAPSLVRPPLLTSIAVIVLLLSACGASDTVSGEAGTSQSNGADTTQGSNASVGGRQDGGELTFAFAGNEEGDVTYLTPQAGSCSRFCNSIYAAIYDSLLYQDPQTNELVGGLARDWELSDDGLTWKINLKEATFHDGEPVTADDVVFSFDLATNEEYMPYNAYAGSLLANVESLETVDEDTVQITMAEPQANFAESVLARAYFGIVSQHSFEELGFEAFSESPVGSGPFKFVEWAQGDHITLERNPDYTWGPAFMETAGSPPSLERLSFMYIQEGSTRLAAFESGQINAMDGIPVHDQSRLQDDPDVSVIEVAKNGSPFSLELNNADGPTADVAIREAISMAIDREALNQAVFAGTNAPICTLLEERMKHVDPEACVPTYDPEGAQSTLEEAGWLEGPDGVRERDGARLELIGLVSSELSDTLEFVQAQLAAVGISLEVQPNSQASVKEAIQSPTGWHVALHNPVGWTNEDPNVLRSQFHSSLRPPGGTLNSSWYENPDVDELLDAGLSELDDDTRRDIYSEAQQLIAADVPTVPLVSIRMNIATRPNVHGIMPDVRGTYRYFHDVWIEE